MATLFKFILPFYLTQKRENAEKKINCMIRAPRPIPLPARRGEGWGEGMVPGVRVSFSNKKTPPD
jgi:hypothetical protein